MESEANLQNDLQSLTVVTPATPPVAPAPSPFREFWRSFSYHKGALLGVVVFIAMIACALLANQLAPHSPIEQHREALLTPPAWAEDGSIRFLLGTDDLGRDMLSRLMFGARLSLAIGLIAVVLAMVPGVVLG